MAYERQDFKSGQILRASHLKLIEDCLCESSPVIDSFKFTKDCIGKTIRVAAVDDNGKPTKWQVVDLSKLVAQSDLSENDETAPSFVKGRTHWVEEIGGDDIVPEQTVNITSGRGPAGGFGEPLVVGDKYDVFVDGIMYTCVAKEHEGELALGNTTLIGGPEWGSGEDTGEPFAFTTSNEGATFVVWTEADFTGSLTVAAFTARSVVYHKLDPEFLPEGAGNGGANYLLTLSTNEADAQANSDAVTAAVAEHKHVVLQRGDYPVKPGIVVESGKLDMNGARFYTVDYKSETPLVYLKGESPEICNGELEGSYDLADNEVGYSFFESECLIRPEGVNDAYIHHMDLHNNWGYCIHPGEVCAKFYVDSGTVPSGINDKVYFTEPIPIPEGYKFITAAGGIGYNYIISVYPVAYKFYNADGVEISKGTGIPRKRHTIPVGAVTVKIGTYTNSDSIVPYYTYFTNYEETLVVSDCKFHNYHSLGMANMPGPTTVTRCSFVEGGKPRSDVYGTFRGTVGGIDIEDIQTPELIMSDCWSRDSGKLLMFGGYKGVVTNCMGGSIGIYRGWHCDIANCNVAELYTMGGHCRITTNSVHADTVSIKDENIKDVRGDISTFSLDSKNLCRFDSFVVDVDTSSDSNSAVISGKVNGRIKGVTSTGIGFKECSSAPGSRIEFDSTVTGSNGNYYGAVKVTGDTYGLVSNVPFFPNGQTIHDSIFNIGAQVTAYGWADVTWSGGFKNCVFNLTGGTFFRLFAKSPAEPVELTFEGCTINNANYYLFNFVPFAGSKVTFKNCTIADESKLFNGNTSGITIEFVSGGEGSVEIDASLTVEGRAADAKAVGEALASVIPSPSAAQVGQTIVVSEVDAEGKPTKWEAAKFPAGVGGEEWELIVDYTVPETANSLTIDKDLDGNPFELKRWLVLTIWTPVAGVTVNHAIQVGFSKSSSWGQCLYASFGAPNETETAAVSLALCGVAAGNQILEHYEQAQNRTNVAYHLRVTNPDPVGRVVTPQGEFTSQGFKGNATCIKLCGYQSECVHAGSIVKMWGVRA